MKIITSKVHGVLDYLVGVLFLALPYLAGWETASAQSRVFQVLGAMTIVYSLATRYELGLFKMIPFRVHLILDVVSGLFLIASPWLFAFADEVYLPHVLLGAFELLAVMMTVSRRETDFNIPNNL